MAGGASRGPAGGGVGLAQERPAERTHERREDAPGELTPREPQDAKQLGTGAATLTPCAPPKATREKPDQGKAAGK